MSNPVVPDATTYMPINYTDNWQEKTNLQGKKYYYNTETKKSQEVKPDGITPMQLNKTATPVVAPVVAEPVAPVVAEPVAPVVAPVVAENVAPVVAEPVADHEDSNKTTNRRGVETKFRITTVLFAIISIMGDLVLGLSEAAKEIHENIDPTNSFGIVGTEANAKLKDLTQELVNMTGNAHDKMKKYSDKAREAIQPTSPQTGGAAKDGKSQGTSNSSSTGDNSKLPSAPSKQDMQDTLDKTKQEASKALKKGEEIAITAMKSIILLYETGIGYAMQYGLGIFGQGDILEKPYVELNAEFNNELTTFSTFLNDAATNPESREAIKELAKAIAVTAVIVMDDIKPEVMHVTDTAVGMMEDIATKGTRGATATMISIVQSFLAEIPWVGGIIDIMIAVGKGFNTAAEVYKVFVTKSANMVVTSAKVAKKSSSAVTEGSERIASAFNKIKSIESKQTVNTIKPNTPNTPDTPIKPNTPNTPDTPIAVGQSGGGRGSNGICSEFLRTVPLKTYSGGTTHKKRKFQSSSYHTRSKR